MKLSVFLTTVALFGFGAQTNAQDQVDSTGMPGDNLDLYAVLDQFKKSGNLEDFEKSINDPNNKINNLDLNEDGETDYIKVIDNADSGAHAIVLQVPYNQYESQDVAVIEVEQEGVENARIQIVGNEEVYGEDYVVEPYEKYVSQEQWNAQQYNEYGNSYNGSYNSSSYNSSYNSSSYNGSYSTSSRVYVNVYTWPCVNYIYRPVYRPWRSPWYWGYYPNYWRPWRPHHWHAYHGYMGYYHGPSYCYRSAPSRSHFYGSNRVYRNHCNSSASYRRTAPAHRYNRNTNGYNYRGDNRSSNGGSHSGGRVNYSNGGHRSNNNGNHSNGGNHSGGGHHSNNNGNHSNGGNYSGGGHHSNNNGNHSNGGNHSGGGHHSNNNGNHSNGGNHSGGGHHSNNNGNHSNGGNHSGGGHHSNGGNHSGGGHHSGGNGSYSGGGGHHSGGGGNHSGGGNRVRRR